PFGNFFLLGFARSWNRVQLNDESTRRGGSIQNCRCMDKEQLTARFLANRHSLLSFIYAFVRNMQDAEDIFQEVWLRFSRALERNRKIKDPARCCEATAKNPIQNHWRDRKNPGVFANPERFDRAERAFVQHEVNGE